MTIRMVHTPAARAKRAVLVIAMLTTAVVIGPQAFADGPDQPVASDTYTVVQGETLWSIATTVTGPGGDVRATVAEIQDLNDMSGSGIRSGEQILVPALER